MEKHIILKRLEFIRDQLDGEMRVMTGQLKADAQADIAALDYAIRLVQGEDEDS